MFTFLDINNKDIRDANNAHTDSDDEGESMDWYVVQRGMIMINDEQLYFRWSKYFASLDKMIMVSFTTIYIY